MRELTKNEKVLLSLLGILIIGWGTYQFIIMPQSRKLEAFSVQKTEYQEQVDEIQEILSKEDHMHKDLSALIEEKDEIVSRYFPTLHQPQVIYLLNDLLAQTGITILDMNFNKPSYEEFGDLQVKNMILSIDYEGTYSGVVDVIKAIKNSPRKMLVESVSMDKYPEGELEGNITIKIYGLDDMVDADGNVIEIRAPKRDLGRNPFLAYSGYRVDGPSSSGESPRILTGNMQGGPGPSMGNVPGELDGPQGLNPYSPGFSVDYEKENAMSVIPDEGVK